MSKIKVNDILEKHGAPIDDLTHADGVLAAIKEIVDTVLDRAADEAELKSYPYNCCPECGRDDMDVDKHSILALKKEVDYE